MMIVWWLGALLAEVYVGRVRVSFRRIGWLVGLLPVLVLVKARGVEPHPVLWGLGFAGLMAVGFGGWLRGVERLKWLGDCSYTLYVGHMPVLVLVSGWLMARSPTGELPRHVGWVAAALVLVPAAWAVHLFVERPFTASGRRGRRPVSPSPC
jgi:peptidoglycan/LPS O-acetylase OafA/YrhL